MAMQLLIFLLLPGIGSRYIAVSPRLRAPLRMVRRSSHAATSTGP